MNLFEIVFWLAMVAEMVIRAPINKKRKAEAMSRQQVTRQEKTLLVLLLLGMFIFPLVYSATSWLILRITVCPHGRAGLVCW